MISDEKPLVSAIVSLYKAEKFVRAKLDDLLAQSLGDRLEIVVVNSGSPQGEDEIVREYLNYHRNIIYIHTLERESIYAAWNRGIKAASGRFITNSNADDYLRSDALEVMANVLQSNKDIGLVYASQVITTEPLKRFTLNYKRRNVIHAPDYEHLLLLYRCFIGSQPMWRSSIHSMDNIWFNEKYEVAGDYDFELRVAQKYKFMGIPETLGTLYKDPNRSNRETLDRELTVRETEEVLGHYTRDYFATATNKELIRAFNCFKNLMRLPLPIYYLLKKCDNALSSPIYPRYFPYSIEYTYLMGCMLLKELGETSRVMRYCKKFLRYRSSKEISELFVRTGV